METCELSKDQIDEFWPQIRNKCNKLVRLKKLKSRINDTRFILRSKMRQSLIEQ
jgi:hypothetical protein